MAYECQNCSHTAAFCSLIPAGCCTRCDHRPIVIIRNADIALARDESEAVQFDQDMSALYRLRAKVTSAGLDFPPLELDIWGMTFDLIWDDITDVLDNWPTDDKAAIQIADWKTLNRRKRVLAQLDKNLLEQIGKIA
jgi:hypothetical protein